MKTHGEHFKMIQQDKDDNDASNDDGEKNDLSGVSSSHSSEPRKGKASSNSDDAEDSTSYNETTEDENSVHGDTVQQVKVAGQDNNRTSNSEDLSSVSNQVESCANSGLSLDDIVTHVESLNEHGVTFDGVTGRHITTGLGLMTTPNLKRTDHKILLQHQVRQHERRQTTVQENR